jgi:hypothetical protein
MDSAPRAQEPVRNPLGLASAALGLVAILSLVGLFKADWDTETSFLTAVGAAFLGVVLAAAAVVWSISKRGRGWAAALIGLLVSLAALCWCAWTFVILLRAAA